MGVKIDEWNENNIFECEYDKWKGKSNLTSLQAEGICYRFSKWLQENDVAYDDPDDVYNNTSEIRDGNRLDIHDNYVLNETDYEISYLYSVNGTVWAVLYDTENGCWYGEIEINAVQKGEKL